MLHWLVANQPATVAAAAWALQPKDWLRMRLVGQAGSEPSDASGTLLFDVLANRWALPVVEALGLPARLLPPLGEAAASAGPLGARAAAELGLRPGTQVAFGAADTAAALVGTGLSEVGAVQLTVGSAAQAVTLRSQPAPDPALRYHVFAGAPRRSWYALAAVQASGIALSWALDALGASWDEAYQAVADVPIGANGAVFVPHVAGARSPSMNYAAQAGFLHLELRHQRQDLLRAVFEGVAFSIADALECLPEFSATAQVYLAGGGSLHPRWRQLLCDLAGRRLLVVENPNASARGAALMGLQAAGLAEIPGGTPPVVGTVQPDTQAHAALLEAFACWRASSGPSPAP
jgi:xylulokinase